MNLDRPVLGMLLMLAFCMSAPLNDVAAKLAAATIPVGQITAARYIVQAAILIPVAMVMGLTLRLDRAALGVTILRAVLSILSTFTFIAAIKFMPLADALAIAFVEPFILLFIGHAFLGHHIGWRRLAAAVVGFGGSLIIIQPSFREFGAVALLPLGTALSFALYMLTMRGRSLDAHPVQLQATTALVAAVLILPILALGETTGWRDLDPAMPAGLAWAFLFGVGLASSLSHMFLTYALRFASSTVLAPMHYLELISATFFGFMVFGDFPKPGTWAGILIIAGAGIYVFWREQVAARGAAAKVAPGPAGV